MFYSTFTISSSSSQVPKAVDTWKAELVSKKRPNIAASVAHPDANPELFEEGWAQALACKCMLHIDKFGG